MDQSITGSNDRQSERLNKSERSIWPEVLAAIQ